MSGMDEDTEAARCECGHLADLHWLEGCRSGDCPCVGLPSFAFRPFLAVRDARVRAEALAPIEALAGESALLCQTCDLLLDLRAAMEAKG